MDRNFIFCARTVANNEIINLINEFNSQLDEKLKSLFNEDDKDWVEKVMAVAFQEKHLNFDTLDTTLKKALFIAARRAKLLMYLQGLDTQKQIEDINNNPKKCLGRLISQEFL